MAFIDLNYDEMLNWFDHNIHKCLITGYWIIIILISIFHLVITSDTSLKLLCPISEIWTNLLFQTIVSTYGLFCVVFLPRGDCHDILTSLKEKFIYCIDCCNICLCVFALLHNIVAMWNTCNDKISHTSVYTMSNVNIGPILSFLIISILMVLHKNMILRQSNNEQNLYNSHNLHVSQPSYPHSQSQPQYKVISHQLQSDTYNGYHYDDNNKI